MVASIMMVQPCQNLAKDDVIPQIIFETPEENGNRSPATVSGYVDLSVGLAVLNFTSNLGNAQVRLENLNTGDYASDEIVANNTVIIPFSCSSGQWKVTISVSGGSIYIGHFEL